MFISFKTSTPSDAVMATTGASVEVEARSKMRVKEERERVPVESVKREESEGKEAVTANTHEVIAGPEMQSVY